MIDKNKQKTKEIKKEVFSTLHKLNFGKVKFPKNIDGSLELKSSNEVSFGSVRQEIFQDGEDVINELDARAFSIIQSNTEEN